MGFEQHSTHHIVEFFVFPALARIERKLDALLKMEGIALADLTSVQNAVANETTVDQSAITLLNQLAEMIRANVTDQAALNDLANAIDANASGLSAAVAANQQTPTAAPGPTDGGPAPTP